MFANSVRGAWMALALLAATTALPAAAMVPPVFQRLGELQAILGLRALPTTLAAPIDRIELIGPRLYRVSAGRCHVDVQLVEVRGGPGEGLTPPRLQPVVGAEDLRRLSRIAPDPEGRCGAEAAAAGGAFGPF